MAKKHDDIGNPPYPNLGAAVEKHRRLAKSRELTLAEKKAYGRAVLEAVNALNAPKPAERIAHKYVCASGTGHNDGASILAAVNAQNRARVGREVWSHEIAAANAARYEAHMIAQRKRLAASRDWLELAA
jgi:hypothetical protein